MTLRYEPAAFLGTNCLSGKLAETLNLAKAHALEQSRSTRFAGQGWKERTEVGRWRVAALDFRNEPCFIDCVSPIGFSSSMP